MKNFPLSSLLFSLLMLLSSSIVLGQTLRLANQDDSNSSNGKALSGKYAAQYQQVLDSYDLVKGASTLAQAIADNNISKRNLYDAALIKNIPLQKYNEDGTFDQLIAFTKDGTPLYYALHNVAAARSTRADHLNTGGSLGLNLNGNGMTAGIWDGGPTRPTHQEFDVPPAGGPSRITINDGQTTLNGNSFHAQHVSGTVAASGYVANSKGMAWQADLLTHDWTNDDIEARAEAMAGLLLSNHSYGIPVQGALDAGASYFMGQYNSNGVTWDDIMYDYPYYLMIKSAGNDGNNNGNLQPLGGNNQYDKLTADACAKNNMVIANGTDANVDANGNLISVSRNSSSSEGPTDDYRVKPDITGNGTGLYSCYDGSDSQYNSISGTSMSAPNVTGTLLLLQEHAANVNGSFMRAATLKGLALHTADDVNGAGPDAEFGWGLLNAKFAAETITAADANNNAVIQENTLSNGNTYTIQIQSDGTSPLQASISWTDPAGTPDNSTTANVGAPALVNDLDIRLSNGTTYYPWRLTGVNTNSSNANGGNGNTVDPYERIDISGASGVYTLTISHKGTLSADQAYSLIVTGGTILPSTPQIGFSPTTGSGAENSGCSFTDYDVTVSIANAASANADVTFSVNGSSTAAENVDFELLTSSVTFPAGSTADQTMTIRVYEDGIVEGDETILIDLSVNPNGGDATANTSADQFTFTITNDDLAPVATEDIVLLTEDFEDLTGWENRDGDGDTYAFLQISFTSGGFTGFAGNFIGSETNMDIIGGGGTGIANANNYFVSPQITIPANTTNTAFNFAVAGFNTIEHYALYWATDISTNAAINSSVVLEERNATADAGDVRSVNNTGLAGQTGHFVVRHYNSSANNGIFLFDDLSIIATTSVGVQTAVNSGTTDASFNFGDAGSAYAYDTSSDLVMVGLTNNQSDDYGCTTVSVSRAGTGAQGYDGSTGADQVTDKSFTVATANTIATGDVDMDFYFAEAEVAGWETATGNSRNNLYIGREVGGTIVEAVSASIGAFGANVTLGANFASAEGDFYFGLQTAFVSCAGGAKTWNGSAWSPAGAPANNHTVLINGTYDTDTDGNIEACEIIIATGVTLTVEAGDYIRAQGDIIVSNNASLIVQPTGSVVQVDGGAVVNKGAGATINVNVVSPVLQTRDFMVMGSPMTAETRNGVFDSAFLVLNHLPNSFNPHDHPNIPQGATNFKDKEGDFWNVYSGNINVGEGYIVRPQSGYTDPANTTYPMTYEQGTLNNGDVTRSVVYNATNSPLGTPNVFANPYASGISADAFITDNGLNALYFWEHLTPPTVIVPGESIMFDMGDVSIRNLGGGVAANNGGSAPNNVISTGQGFAIKATSTGMVTFDNSMRLTTNNTLRSPDEALTDRLWLRVESDEYQTGNNTLIAFHPNATSGWDNGYDTDRLASMVSLYSQLETGDERMAIQTTSQFDSAMRIPVGFSTLVEDETGYTISILGIEGDNLNGAGVYLYDSHLDRLVDLKKGDYSFTSNVSEDDRRFTILFEEGVLGTAEQRLESITAYPNPTESVLNIVSPQTGIDSVKVIDVRGRTIAQHDLGGVQSYRLDMGGLNSAMYFVEITTPEGTVTKRIVKQ